ncbi:MAG: hypothetical protein J6M38_04865 [Lentisphaeria bacterium]|nr:hypothetical protein [Lentisphaeria bacterium]
MSWVSGEPLIAQRAKFPPGALLWSRISGGSRSFASCPSAGDAAGEISPPAAS